MNDYEWKLNYYNVLSYIIYFFLPLYTNVFLRYEPRCETLCILSGCIIYTSIFYFNEVHLIGVIDSWMIDSFFIKLRVVNLIVVGTYLYNQISKLIFYPNLGTN
jgi:hypothetical protein